MKTSRVDVACSRFMFNKRYKRYTEKEITQKYWHNNYTTMALYWVLVLLLPFQFRWWCLHPASRNIVKKKIEKKIESEKAREIKINISRENKKKLEMDKKVSDIYYLKWKNKLK